MNQLSNTGHSSVFENIKKINDSGVEYWLARDFQFILQYSSWDKFLNVVEKAKEACRNSGHNPADHFSHTVKMVSIGSGARRETEDKLRRENVRGKDRANQTHFEVGKKIRQTIRELGGTMPESLPSAENIKKLANKKRQVENK